MKSFAFSVKSTKIYFHKTKVELELFFFCLKDTLVGTKMAHNFTDISKFFSHLRIIVLSWPIYEEVQLFLWKSLYSLVLSCKKDLIRELNHGGFCHHKLRFRAKCNCWEHLKIISLKIDTFLATLVLQKAFELKLLIALLIRPVFTFL